jgi:hypothetical protein
MGSARWWHYGLIGGLFLLFAAVRSMRRLVGHEVETPDWSAAVGYAAAAFAMGFLGGVVVWAGRGVSRRLGVLGDGLVGMAIVLLIVAACMLLFDPELLGPKFLSVGVPTLGLGAIVGLLGGAWLLRDLRQPPDRGGDDAKSGKR